MGSDGSVRKGGGEGRGAKMIVGGYLLHLYCDGENCDAVERHRIQMEFGGRDKAAAVKEAKRRGWHVGYKHQYCPACTGRTVFESDLKVKGLTPAELASIPEGPFRYIPKAVRDE